MANERRSAAGRRSRLRRLSFWAAAAACGWLALAYFVLPLAWRHYENQRKLEGMDMATRTPDGIPGDPVNVGLVGSRIEILCAFALAGWRPADPVTLKTGIEIVGSVLFDQAYETAPVSPLLLFGRREDLSFEKRAGKSADRRHHIRLWKALDSGRENRPVWIGAATFDRSVGFSRYTLQVTHHIDADIDAERSAVIGALSSAGAIAQTYSISGIGPTLNGRNGGGDRYFTDGDIAIAVLRNVCAARAAVEHAHADEPQPAPALVRIKNSVWRFVRTRLRSGSTH